MASCLLGIGSNLGDRRSQIVSAVSGLRAHPQIESVYLSSLHESRPVGGPPGQGSFLNAAARLETSLEPHALLRVTQECERSLGRQRSTAWDARLIDLDLLLFEDLVVADAQLQIPHPWMIARNFVLAPSVEVAAAMIHPQFGFTVEQLQERLRTIPPRYVVWGDLSFLERAEITERCGGRWVGFSAKDPVGFVFPTGELDVEFVRSAVTLLTNSPWCEPNLMKPCLTEIWPDLVQTIAQRELSGQELTDFQQLNTELTRSLPMPKLVVMVRSDRTSDIVATMERELIRSKCSPFLTIPRSKRLVDQVASAVLASN